MIPKIYNAAAMQIMRLLVGAGANPLATVSDYRGKDQFSAVRVVEAFLLESFPQEAAALLQEIQQKLELVASDSKKRQKTTHVSYSQSVMGESSSDDVRSVYGSD